MSTHEPGTVAWASIGGRASFRVMRVVTSRGPRWVHTALDDGRLISEDRHVTDVRPLVVLDPRDVLEEASSDPAEEVARSLRNLAKNDRHNGHGGYETTYRARIATNLADHIEAQTKPPRIPEPGLWGVVEATLPGLPRRRWVHHEEDRWVSDVGIPLTSWECLADPTLIREGLS